MLQKDTINEDQLQHIFTERAFFKEEALKSTDGRHALFFTLPTIATVKIIRAKKWPHIAAMSCSVFVKPIE